MFTEQTLQSKTFKISSEVSRIIWGYALEALDQDSDDVPLATVSFHYSTYHYAVIDYLKRNGIAQEVLDLFAPSACFLMQADYNNPYNQAELGKMLGTVTSLLDWMQIDNMSPFTIDGAKQILALEHYADQSASLVSKFYRQPSDSECTRYLESVNNLRRDVDTFLNQSCTKPSNPNYIKSGLIVGAVIGAIAAILSLFIR